jgi:hypothetical protein
MFSFKINFFQSFNKTLEDFIHKKPQNLDYLGLSLIPETERRHPREKKIKALSEFHIFLIINNIVISLKEFSYKKIVY